MRQNWTRVVPDPDWLKQYGLKPPTLPKQHEDNFHDADSGGASCALYDPGEKSSTL
jgi:hypothetical protein